MPRVGLVGMLKSPLEIRSAQPLLDIVSYGRQGPKGTVALSAAQIDEINRTVRRVPEVMRELPSAPALNDDCMRQGTFRAFDVCLPCMLRCTSRCWTWLAEVAPS